MSRILAAWELGANLGHIDRLLPLACALREQGHEVSFLLRDLSRAHARVASQGFAMGQAPVWLPRMVHPPRLVNYALVLAEAGWLDAAGLAGLLSGWHCALDALRPDLLLCDHAPTAVLAARGRGLPAWTVGSSFEQPPPGAVFPPLAFWNPAATALCAASDAQVLAPANEALARHGQPALPRLAALFDQTQRALMTLPEMAHYDGYPAGTPFLGPMFRDDGGAEPDWPAGDGPRVFAYLSPTHAEFNPLMAALRQANLVSLVYAPGLSAEAGARLAGARLRLSAVPLHMGHTVAQADIVISHGGMGTTSAALLAGKPQLLLPTHMEQAMSARRLQAAGLALAAPLPAPPSPSPTAAKPAGVGATPPRPDWTKLLQRLLNEPGLRQCAKEAATRHAGHGPATTAARVATLLHEALNPRG